MEERRKGSLGIPEMILKTSTGTIQNAMIYHAVLQPRDESGVWRVTLLGDALLNFMRLFRNVWVLGSPQLGLLVITPPIWGRIRPKDNKLASL